MKKRYFVYIVIALVLGFGVYSLIEISKDKVERTTKCWVGLNERINSTQNLDELLHDELAEFQILVEQSLVIRSQMLLITKKLREDKEGPIPSKQLEILKEGTAFAISLREKLYNVAERYECATSLSRDELDAYHVSPELRLKATMMSLGAALTLYDNYLFGALMFEEDKRLRRLINDPDLGFGIEAHKLLEVSWAANSIEKQNRIQNAIEFFEKEVELITNGDDDYEYLILLVNSSPAYNYIRDLRKRDMLKNKFKLFGRLSRDVIAELRDDGFNSVGKFFGNSVGLIEARKGKLFNKTDVTESLLAVLQPMDILLEKTPFRLTDKLIPGHFGHVAIWSGKELELIDLGVWEDSVITPYHNSVHNCNVIEALRSGVQINPLEDFLNVDDVAILRPVFSEGTKTADMKEALLLAFRQIGKEYDFNFDVNTTDKIVCSELAYISYPTIDWTTEKALGRYTISPDNVAKLCWNGMPLELITFYHDGELVEKEKQLSLLKKLMEEG
ncbi:MAG: hypothetical protein JKY42_01165 [Flavobacteriales bacterium]|nr:hypothetical protein [Flavobacteriales bacterium]